MKRLLRIIRTLRRLKQGEQMLQRAATKLLERSFGRILIAYSLKNECAEMDALLILATLRRELNHEWDWMIDHFSWQRDKHHDS